MDWPRRLPRLFFFYFYNGISACMIADPIHLGLTSCRLWRMGCVCSDDFSACVEPVVWAVRPPCLTESWPGLERGCSVLGSTGRLSAVTVCVRRVSAVQVWTEADLVGGGSMSSRLTTLS